MILRLKKIIDNEGISVRAFEQKISASNGLIRKAIANNTDIQGKWIVAVAENYPQYNAEWLLTGNGPMLKTEGEKKEDSQPELQTEARPDVANEIAIRLIQENGDLRERLGMQIKENEHLLHKNSELLLELNRLNEKLIKKQKKKDKKSSARSPNQNFSDIAAESVVEYKM